MPPLMSQGKAESTMAFGIQGLLSAIEVVGASNAEDERTYRAYFLLALAIFAEPSFNPDAHKILRRRTRWRRPLLLRWI